jgi:hypothetical protein
MQAPLDRRGLVLQSRTPSEQRCAMTRPTQTKGPACEALVENWRNARLALDAGDDQAARWRLAIFAIVALLAPVAACMVLQDCPASNMPAMPALRSTSS